MSLIAKGLPGEELVIQGLADLAAGIESIESLIVEIGAPRLRSLGFHIQSHHAEPERRLYDVLYAQYGDAAHGRYNAYVRRLVSFEHAAAIAS